MPRPVCVGCEKEMRCEKNEQRVELMSRGYGDLRSGYQIWSGDKYECPSCGAEVIVGFGYEPEAEVYNKDAYARALDRAGDDIIQIGGW